ncbi:hypothetical protein [Escherichia coli]|uniref:hypothetical protein n=1 Tax=Escherichia coli TaxID=562 RepID=UPI003D9C8E93
MFPWTAETGCGYSSPRKVHSGKQAAGVAAEGLTAPSADRSGSPKPRQRVRRRLAGAPAAACRSRA